MRRLALLALFAAACDAPPPADRPAVWERRFAEAQPPAPTPAAAARLLDPSAVAEGRWERLAPGLPAATSDGATVAVLVDDPSHPCGCPVLSVLLLNGRSGAPTERLPLLTDVESTLIARGGAAAARERLRAIARAGAIDARLVARGLTPLPSLGLEEAALAPGEDLDAELAGRRFVFRHARASLQLEEGGRLVAATRLAPGEGRGPGCAGELMPPVPATAHRLPTGALLVRATYAGTDRCAPPPDAHRIVAPLPARVRS